MRRIIKVKDTLYYILGTMDVVSSEKKSTEYWKKQWGADTVLKNGTNYYYCMDVIEAEFEDIK
tara:strand:+ start:44 stop:232 length:189 start_codon:yes stop_codon:yes gene_type:complete